MVFTQRPAQVELGGGQGRDAYLAIRRSLPPAGLLRNMPKLAGEE